MINMNLLRFISFWRLKLAVPIKSENNVHVFVSQECYIKEINRTAGDKVDLSIQYQENSNCCNTPNNTKQKRDQT